MMDLGRVCIKTAGRDAGMHSVIVDILDSNMVLVDNVARRKKCSVLHLQPTEHTLDIEQGASREGILSLLQQHVENSVRITKK